MMWPYFVMGLAVGLALGTVVTMALISITTPKGDR